MSEENNFKQICNHKIDILEFGKHKGKSIRWVIEHEPSYIQWLNDNRIVKFSQEILDNVEDKSWELE